MTTPLVTPKTLATGTDDPTDQISKNVWNAGHEITLNAAGDLIIGGTAGAAQNLPVGTDGQVLKVISGAPGWGSDSTGTGGGLTLTTGTDAATTMIVGSDYAVDMSAWATADRVYKLPTCSAGDELGIIVTSGNASYELIVQGDTGVSLNGISAAEWSRLFITGERLTFKAVATNTWMVTYDGRIPCKMMLRLSTAATGEAANTFVLPTSQSGVWTADTNVGACGNASIGRFSTRRTGVYSITARVATSGSPADGAFFDARSWDGTTTYAVSRVAYGASHAVNNTLALSLPLAAGSYQELQYRTQAGSIGLAATSIYSVYEVL